MDIIQKVYCDSCAYLSSSDYSDCCENKNNWVMRSNWRRRYKEYQQSPEVKNSMNDCPDFKLVWYKRLLSVNKPVNTSKS